MSTATTEAPAVEQAPASTETAPPAPAPSPADVAAQQAAAKAEADMDPWADPERARAKIEALQRENAKNRAAPADAAKEAREQVLQELGKTLGFVKDEQATPEQLAERVTEATKATETATADARAARVELAVFRAADTHNADAQTLLDSRKFTDTLTDLDYTDEAAVNAAIKKAVTDNPRFLKARAAGASTLDSPGGSGEGTTTPAQFAKMSGAERNTLFNTNPTLYAQLTGR